MKTNSKEFSKLSSDRKKKWWEELKKKPIIFKQFIDKITIPLKKIKRNKGKKSTGWKGGKYSTKRDGYIYLYCPEHPFSVRGGKGGGGYVLEHRLVMEKILGRYLTKEEDVHHKNGIKNDNRPKNLK